MSEINLDDDDDDLHDFKLHFRF